jgi:methionyl-tRNA synthetase
VSEGGPVSAGRVMVISPAPTANGDLHLGHLAGPFLAADVYVRHARAQGHEVLFGTGVQDTQTYVVTTARRLGITPQALVARSTEEVRATLAAWGIGVDGFTGTEDRFTKWVVEFIDRLHSAGRLAPRAVTLPYRPRTGEYLVDGHVAGGCPNCLADGCAGLCESCGHPIWPGDLIDPRSTAYPDEPVEPRPAIVLVLPLEEYRAGLVDYLARHRSAMRPHMAQAFDEMLSRPLPDFPITYPIGWGIPAPFPEVPGQVINPNAEMMAWSTYCTALAAEGRGLVLAAEDELWSADERARIVYFLGFDNTYVFAVAGVAMLLAHGDRYRLPDHFIANEFYELDHEKFSTSRGHVVPTAHLLARVPRDLLRFHLAATSPEFQRTNFSPDAVARTTSSRLVRPWNRVAAAVDAYVGRGPLRVSERSRMAARRIVERFEAAYDIDRFSLNRAAETLTEQLARLERRAGAGTEPGDLCHEVDVFRRCAAPILIDLGAGVEPAGLRATGVDATEVTPRSLPRLASVEG